MPPHPQFTRVRRFPLGSKPNGTRGTALNRYRGRTNCRFDGCTVSACCGVKGSNNREYCSRHALAGMARLDGKGCIHPGCLFEASYGIEGGKSREFCARHASEQKVATLPRNAPKRKACLQQGCETSPSYGMEGTGKREYCSTHARPGMTYRGRPTCRHPGCSMSACCGVEGSTKAELCTQHALAGMTRIGRKNCIRPGCFMEASYSLPGRSQREVCRRHSNPAGDGRKGPSPASHAFNIRLGEDFDPGLGAGIPGRVSSSEENEDTAMDTGKRRGGGFPDVYSPNSRFNGAAAAGGAYGESSSHVDDVDAEQARGMSHESWRGPSGRGSARAAHWAHGGDDGHFLDESSGADGLGQSRGGSAARMHAGMDANRWRRSASELGDRPRSAGDDSNLGVDPRALSPPGPVSSDQGQDRPGDKPFRLLTPHGWVNWDWNSALANARMM